ncbi:homoserine O-succinyltransferase [Ruminococcaceae bacterium OttesenSCG-928-A16]|nr:homoserine O-succinyltransferase [Ruminococcaceae bacterium OttesenSCG-928-A16]
MPLILPPALPAVQILQDENIFIMPQSRAASQDIRPLEILVVNLMPDKIETETQLARMLANSPLQVKLTLLRTGTHTATHTSTAHMAAFYKTLDEVQRSRFDGMIVTGAPIEHLPYEEVDYWEELKSLFAFSRQNVYSTIYLCWGALAGLYYHYGIPKTMLPQKLSGVFSHRVTRPDNPLVRGFDEHFYAPHSRNAGVLKQEVEKHPGLRILAESEEAGLHMLSTKAGREIYILGHMEYDKETLKNEYNRDLARGLAPSVPKNYFENDDPNAPILYRWRSHAHLLFSNWLNYYVYQSTPFDLNTLAPETPEK